MSKPKGYWNNYENCYEAAKKCKSVSEFAKLYHGAWLQRKIAKSGFWQNHDNCLNESKKYKARTEFSKGNNSAYVQSLKNGWIDEFFPKTD